jgi:hypothetical protein
MGSLIGAFRPIGKLNLFSISKKSHDVFVYGDGWQPPHTPVNPSFEGGQYGETDRELGVI